MTLRRSNGWADSTSPHLSPAKENHSPVKLNIDPSVLQSKPSPSKAPQNTFTQKANKRPITVKLSDVNRPPWEVEMGIRGTYGLLMGKPKSIVRGNVLNSSVIFKSPEERQKEKEEEEAKKKEEEKQKAKVSAPSLPVANLLVVSLTHTKWHYDVSHAGGKGARCCYC